ncbi:DUF3618 domain-containing protein [Nonomuraea sp. FMUSA5-5]|uniref:DUF3618 domain-containing protein n=1 Tax=Nonomuraea composti TaxID=2720023 RepID=A0ABX1B229_9ACTN|nr:DUF3618 domain-containing protein [Nonomuraea sp. FMUSA5-5]NJP89053.1 DUF3618 domain-containing protein [Nonomuraea sp. FMUSA5-5]
MSETDPGYSQQHAGDVGAHRATVGTPTERESINVPPTRPEAADNARRAEAARQEHETFIPEAPIQDERSEAVEHLRTEEESLGSGAGRGNDEEEEDEDDVRKDIQETRREMGETVSQLAAKADVKARAGHAAEVAKDRAGHAAEVAKDRAGHAAEVAKDRAADAAELVKGKASEVAGKVRESTPDQVKDAAAEARKRPVLLIAVVGAVAAFAVRRMMRRRRVMTK